MGLKKKGYTRAIDKESVNTVQGKDFRATLVRRVTAETAAITLAFLFVEMLCYVLGRLHSKDGFTGKKLSLL